MLIYVKAMHLVYRALEKNPVPLVLPSDMIPLSKRVRGSALPGSVQVLPLIPGASVPVIPLSSAAAVLPSAGISAGLPMMTAIPTGRNSPLSVSRCLIPFVSMFSFLLSLYYISDIRA